MDKSFSVTGSYIDFTVEYFPNGTAVLTNNKAPYESVSTKYKLQDDYPYNYISSPLIQLYPSLNGGTSAKVVLYNFEQSVPKNLVTVWADNTQFPFGFDGPRRNYTDGTDWLKTHNQRATIWVDPIYYAVLSDPAKADVLNMINNRDFELGVHFTSHFTSLSWNDALAEMASNTSYLNGVFGKDPLSWGSLGNSDNSTHATEMWSSYSELWRNSPNSMAGSVGPASFISASTDSSNDNIKFWNVASQYNSFFPSMTHSVKNPLMETYSVNTSDFTNVMENYVNSGISIVPYAEWYYENMNTVQPITNMYFSPTNSYFNIDTNGYNATTTIYDPYREGIWYSTGGKVYTTIDNTNITNLIINNPSNLTVKKTNATFTVSSNNITVNISMWNTTGLYYKKWNESSTNAGVTTLHTIGDFPNNQGIQIKKNGVNWNTNTSNATGFITFNYTEGYSSDIQFETQLL